MGWRRLGRRHSEDVRWYALALPLSVRAIEEGEFYNCLGLTTAILNDGLEEIGEYAFSGCVLVCIDIPPSIRAIRNGAFYNCSRLMTANLNHGLEEIGEYAFRGCALVCIACDSTPRVRRFSSKLVTRAAKYRFT